MNLWNSMKNSQMANNIVKWWRTKFLNGYKQFAVECSDGKVSDTEELLERLNSEDNTNDRLRADCTTPPIQNSRSSPVSPPTPTFAAEPPPPPPQETPHHHLNLEEFSCDVSVENGETKSGQERQEFSFTLYDFDGHGKITKDDIAGLVTTIYEALGSSVKVPHYGSKTIKVKLTVSPDQRKHVSATVVDQKEGVNNSENGVRYKRDLNVTIRQGSKENHRHQRRQKKTKPSRNYHCCKHHEEVIEEKKHYEEVIEEKNISMSDESDGYSRISDSSDDEEEGECSDIEIKQNVKHRKNTNSHPRYTIPNLFVKNSNICSQQETCHKTKRLKKRSGSLQRQELLEIIQANMDKNNLNFQTSRKQCPTTHISTETKQLQTPPELKQQKHQYSATKMTTPLQVLANMVDPTHFYVDLASLQNTTGLPQRCDYDKIIDAVMCVSNKKVALATKQNKCRRHKHVKTVDLSHLPIRYQLLDYSVSNEEKFVNKPIKRIQKRNESELNKKNVRKCPEVLIGQASNLHHLKHKNRREDQARSMAQVVNWLEQEFSSTRLKEKPPTKTKGSFTNEEKTGSTPAATPSNVERHEHHHVHEHIHHHYHHYQEAPVVV